MTHWATDSLPVIQQMEPLIATIAKDLGGEAVIGRNGKLRGANVEVNDERLGKLVERWETHGFGSKRQLFIACPFKQAHSGDSGKTECAYFPAGTGG